MKLKVQRLYEDSKLPERAYEGDAGWDLFAHEAVTLYYGPQDMFDDATFKVKTGVAIAIPEGHVGIIKDRSSYGSKGIHTSAGVIDAGYRNEVLVCLTNHNGVSVQINKGDKIAQLVILKIPETELEEVEEVSSDTERGNKGFGSSGK